ncbi:MAG: hypothetical protein ISS45_03700 [Candidatus Omnitrophica bacterium]|nr:hypothetical protein [Candidatus Omnitrophota bacterium]
MKKVLVILTLLFCSAICIGELKAEITTDEEFNNFFTYYYLNPQPNEAPSALRQFISSDFFKSQQPTEIYAMQSYFFGRIAQMNPVLISEYMNLFNDTTHEGRVFILMIFQISGNEQVKAFLQTKLDKEDFINEREDIKNVLKGGMPIDFNPLRREIEDGADLDFLWTEFFITGIKEPIVKIIDVLSWEDRFKNKLTNWLSAKHSKRETKKLNNLLNRVGINIDINKHNLNLLSDFDCMFAAHFQSFGFAGKKSEHGEEIIKILDFSDDDKFYMAIKGAAMWALQSNAQQHPKVLEYCKQEFEQRADKSKIELAIILELASKGSIELVPTEEEDVAILKLREENK